MDYSLATLVVIGFAFVLAGTVKGMLGVGLPTVAMSVLSFRLGMADAVAMLVMPTVLTNLWQLVAGPRFGHLLRRFIWMVLGLTAGAFLGVRLLVDGHLAMLLLGLLLAGYGVLGLSKFQFSLSQRWETRLSPAVGLITGVLYGATGLGISSLPYIGALKLERDELVQAMGLLFTAMSLSTALALAWFGKYQLNIAGTSAAALIPAFIGMAIGQRLRERMDAVRFRQLFFTAMLVLGIYTAVHALG